MLPDGTLQMFEADYRFHSEGGSPQSAILVIIRRGVFEKCWLNSEAAVLRFDDDEEAA